MRFVAVKTEERQAGAMVFRARDLPVRQRAQVINALRGHLAEYGIVAAQGVVHLKRLHAALEAPEAELPATVRDIARLHLDQIARCAEKIAERRHVHRGRPLARIIGDPPLSTMPVEALEPIRHGVTRPSAASSRIRPSA